MTDNNPAADAPVTVVKIISVSYSGSTWLNLMLGSHASAFSIGELKNVLYRGSALCTIHGEDCPFWSQFDTESRENPFLQISRLADRPLLVLNNSRKYLPAMLCGDVKPRFIHLIRDGRTTAASHLRKYPHKNIWRAARWWRHELRRNERLARRLSDHGVLTVRYEDVQRDTPGELLRMCDFVGVDYEPAMADFWEHEHHYIGGNAGTLTAMLRLGADDGARQSVQRRDNKPEAHVNWDLDHYARTDPRNFKDDRWKHELTDRQLRIFRLAAGALNRRYGYPPALDRESAARTRSGPTISAG